MALPVKIANCFGVLKHCKISNSKHQITNKSQIPILNDQNRFGPPEADWSLLFVWYLLFVIWNFCHFSRLPREGKTSNAPSLTRHSHALAWRRRLEVAQSRVLRARLFTVFGQWLWISHLARLHLVVWPNLAIRPTG